MKRVLCDECVKRPIYDGKALREGTYELLPASEYGEPAEWARVVHGLALQPTAKQRTVYVNDAPFPLDPNAFNCDSCNTEIKPGDSAWCLTVWQKPRSEPPRWEDSFITPI